MADGLEGFGWSSSMLFIFHVGGVMCVLSCKLYFLRVAPHVALTSIIISTTTALQVSVYYDPI